MGTFKILLYYYVLFKNRDAGLLYPPDVQANCQIRSRTPVLPGDWIRYRTSFILPCFMPFGNKTTKENRNMKQQTAFKNSRLVLILLLATAMLMPAAGAAKVSAAADSLVAENLTPPHPPGWEPLKPPITRDGGALYPATAFDPASNNLILYKGWNEIATPLWLAEGHNTMAIFERVDMADHPILRYNGSSGSWGTMRLQDEFRPLDGPWIYANKSYRIRLYFKPRQEQQVPVKHLYSGWNAIGFWDVHQACARDMLLVLGNTWSKVQGYDAGTQAYEISMFRDGNGSHSDQRLMFPGKGYWLYMTAEDDLCYPLYRSYSCCAEWVNNYHGMQDNLTYAGEEAEGFYNNLGTWGSSWTGKFINGDDDAMERHWKDPAFGGVDSGYIDSADMAFYSGHGGPDGFAFGTASDDYSMNYDEARWGNTKTDWIVLASCKVLNETTREQWEDAFEGLHSICGFDTPGCAHPDLGWYFADLLMEGKTIWKAWYTATDRYEVPNDGSVRSAILAADIDGDLSTRDCLDDHIYGYGPSINPPGDPPEFQYETDDCIWEW